MKKDTGHAAHEGIEKREKLPDGIPGSRQDMEEEGYDHNK